MTQSHDSRQVRGLDARLLRSLVGSSIRSVSYRMGTGEEDLGSVSMEPIHEVDHAVVVETDLAATVVEWNIDVYDEFLNITKPESAASSTVSRQIDVSNLPQWSRVRGRSIVGFGVSSHLSEMRSELLWSLRIDCTGALSVVIALGRVSDGLPEYQPDSLLVIFRPQLARSFQVRDAYDSAWGRDVAL